MAAPDSTKLQANFKLADGTLINIYAGSQAELEAQLTTVQDLAELIKATSASLGSGGNASYAAKAFNATPVVDKPPFNPAPASTGADPVCAHGPMNFRSGVNASGKAWKGWMCSSPKGSPNQCDTVWVRQIMREPHEFEAPLCAEVGGEYWFPDDLAGEAGKQANKIARSICAKCQHQFECAEWGINNERYGVWGGLNSVALKIARRDRNITLKREDVA